MKQNKKTPVQYKSLLYLFLTPFLLCLVFRGSIIFKGSFFTTKPLDITYKESTYNFMSSSDIISVAATKTLLSSSLTPPKILLFFNFSK